MRWVGWVVKPNGIIRLPLEQPRSNHIHDPSVRKGSHLQENQEKSIVSITWKELLHSVTQTRLINNSVWTQGRCQLLATFFPPGTGLNPKEPLHRSPSASLKVLTSGFVRYFRTVLTPVLISTVAVMPG